VPGQGQTLRVAGVRIGDVSEVELVDGNAVVTFDVDREYLPIYKDATILMRPTTGLKDMFFSMDPGTRTAGEYEEGDTVPMTNTAPDVNLDEILAALDSDSREYLRTMIVGAGLGVKDRGEDLGKLLGALGPVNNDLDRLSTEVAKRDENLKRLIHNLSTLTRAVGQQDDDIARLIDSSNSALSAIGAQDPDVQAATALLPETLRQTKEALVAARGLGDQLGPAFNELRPFARALPEVNEATRNLAESTTPVLRDEIRPFVRAARPVVPDLREAGQNLANAAPKLTRVGGRLNELLNMAAYNPRGAEEPGAPGRDEGYLYWAAWLAHNGVSVFTGQDAHGVYRRIYFTLSCENATNLITDALGSHVPPEVASALLGPLTGLGGLFSPGNVCDAGP
jgi:phospholipid/cholesterol/gamma-HCH transport system substrate-binding protein